ncbi:MAG: toll/interleukin-1 receptor domain-containing protein [Lachnospiraceae bacterium]|nr:toll/interleukin-1 receptor domain-containing protein [Lachnospiraceae bacterium]
MSETNKVKHDVFISYSTKNKNVADAVVADFEQNGIKCWYAPRDILPGEEWVKAVTNALEQSKTLVLIYTDESNNSEQVKNEIAVAFNCGLTIVPFRLSEEQMSSELEYYLTRVHWLDALSKPLKKNIVALREYIEVIIRTPNGALPGADREELKKEKEKERA